jgi:hypothetical protein
MRGSSKAHLLANLRRRVDPRADRDPEHPHVEDEGTLARAEKPSTALAEGPRSGTGSGPVFTHGVPVQSVVSKKK